MTDVDLKLRYPVRTTLQYTPEHFGDAADIKYADLYNLKNECVFSPASTLPCVVFLKCLLATQIFLFLLKLCGDNIIAI